MTDTQAPDVERIRRTLALYCQLLDDGRFDEWGKLYTDDATFMVLGRTYQGPSEIKGFIEKHQPPELRGKHVCANSLIDIDADGVHATARTDYIFVGRTDEGLEITSAGRYHDSLMRVADRWLFRARQIVFVGADQPPPG